MKISIVGPGRVGSAIGLVLVARGLVDELVLVSRRPDVAAGEAADLEHAGAFSRPARVRAGGVQDTADSDIIIIAVSGAAPDATAGRAAGAIATADALREIIPGIAAVNPEAVLLVVSNPLDAITTLVGRLSGFPPSRVLGTGTLLDTMRLRIRLSDICGVHPNDLRVYVLGEHGDNQFVAAASASVGGAPLPISIEQLREIEHDTRNAGHAIVRSKGYTNHGIALAAAEVVEAIARDDRSVLPLSTLTTGVAGVNGVCLSLPVIVGRGGSRGVLPVSLSESEAEAFRKSATAVRQTLDLISPVEASHV
ncbi:MAG: hypothetical protein QM754_03475 [Tepidisphaeraceae bacterium]